MAKFSTLSVSFYDISNGTPPVTLNPHSPGFGYQEVFTEVFYYFLLCVDGVVASFLTYLQKKKKNTFPDTTR